MNDPRDRVVKIIRGVIPTSHIRILDAEDKEVPDCLYANCENGRVERYQKDAEGHYLFDAEAGTIPTFWETRPAPLKFHRVGDAVLTLRGLNTPDTPRLNLAKAGIIAPPTPEPEPGTTFEVPGPSHDWQGGIASQEVPGSTFQAPG